MDAGETIERLAAAGEGIALLRHRVAGVARDAGSDWDLAVADPRAAAEVAEDRFGPPDVRIERQYVSQRFYSWGQLDFLPVFEWNGIEYLAPERFWGGITRSGDGLPRPRLAHDAVIAWLTGLLWGARYNPRYDALIAAALRDDGDELSACLEAAFGRAWAAEMMDFARAGRAGEGAAHATSLRRALWWNALRRAPGETLWNQARHWWTELTHHVRPPFPWIAFLGPDGSGKSSVIQGVAELLEARRLHVDVVHWRPQVLRRSEEVPGGVVTDPHGKSPRGLVVSAMKLGLLALEWWAAWPWQLRHPRAKSRLLFSDRYYDDLLVDPRRYRYGAPLSWARAGFRFLPSPHRVIILAGDPATIHARKQEVTLAEMERQIAAYRALAASLGPRAVVLDACQPLAAVIAAAYSEVLAECRKRSANRPFPAARAMPAAIAARGAAVEGGTGRPERTPGRHRLKVLVSAYACGPDRGAEANVAWNLVRELCASHDLSVLTRKTNREVIEGSREAWVTGVRWIYLDPPPALSFWRQGRRGVQPFYVWWQWLARQRAKELLEGESFDLIHHVTFGTYLLPSPLSDLGVPLVFGPVGGGEKTPPDLSGGYRWSGRLEEILRDVARMGVGKISFLHHWHRSAAWSFAATPATHDALHRLGVSRISMMTQSATGGDAVERFAASHPQPGHGEPGVLRLVSASRLVHWKALDLGIEAVARARAKGLDVRFVILQEGPELRHLKQLTKRLGLESVVEFTGRLPSLDDVFERMLHSDALLHPALHEAFGQACLESLALGVPVICLDWGGPGIIVNETCGFKVQPADRELTVERLAEAMARLAEQKAAGISMAVPAKARAGDFQWRRVAREIEEVYFRITGANAAPGSPKEANRP
jgi:glycosyltransferase involved in cell wall biosynthesis